LSSKDTENSQNWFQIKTYKQGPEKIIGENYEKKNQNLCFVVNTELVLFQWLCENKGTKRVPD